MAPYLVALVLFWLSPNPSPSGEFAEYPGLTSMQFRVIMGLGAIPAAIVLWLTVSDHRMAEPEGSHIESEAIQTSSGGVEASGEAHEVPGSAPIHEALTHPVYFRLLIGTGGTWFLYDVAFYGTSIFLPQILDAIFETHSTDPDSPGHALTTAAWQAVLVTAVGVPGCIAAISLIDPPRGPRWILVAGFSTMAIAFSLLALAFTYEATSNKLLVILLFAFVSFAMNFGPNVGTYVLPTQAYPAEVRSTFHGLSAGAGKLGAVVGTFIYEPISLKYGLPAVMWTQAGLSVLAVLLSVSFLPLDSTLQDAGEHDEEVDADSGHRGGDLGEPLLA
uniref:Major facilitator superfamily (MFS) profile domain-containing protein n=2 Tax=Hemiselmis andersenii TaxID=464988 RepID=A0A7S1EE72_HEMAN